jgi:type IV secretion system protein TrbL
MRNLGKLAAVAALGLVAFAPQLAAQTPPPVGQLDQIVQNFITGSQAWQANIATGANRLFYLLAVIDITWMGINLALKGDGIQAFVAELVRRIFFISFYLALVQYGQSWATLVVNSFQQTGAQAVTDSQLTSSAMAGIPVTSALSPSGVMELGIQYSLAILAAAPSGITSLFVAIQFCFVATVVCVGFGAIACRMVVVLAEMYVILSGGVIMLGFGGSRWTKDYATNYMRFAVAVGLKLMFVQLTVALSTSFISSLFFGVGSVSMAGAFSLLASIGVCAVLVWVLPASVEGFLRGNSGAHGGEAFAIGASTAVTMTSLLMPAISRIAAASAAANGAAGTAGATTRAVPPVMPVGGPGAGSSGKGFSAGMAKPPGAVNPGSA